MKNKKGISLITLAVTIVVMIILASIVILSLTNTGLIKDSKEAKYKNELKAFDEEIREKITTVYLDDKTAMYRIITDSEEISKYSEDLVKSEYIDYAYISGGELTLRGNMLTEEQKKWAQEANIKIDDEEVTFTEEKVMITLSDDDWTYGPISATLSFSEIPKGYEFQYKIGDGKWTSKESIADITRNGTIYARLYNKENYNEIGVNSKDITKIDRISPKIEKVIEPSMWEKDSVKLVVSGAKDNESGLAEKPYSFDDGITWQAANYKDFTTNMSGIIIKIKDAVGNIYTHDSVDITRIDKISPTIESVTGNASEFVTGSVILKVNGAKDNESGLNETAYSFDNGASWQKSNEKEFKNNTSNIIIKVRDAVGNIYTHTSMNIVKIDNEGPEIPTGITVTPHLNKLVVQGKGSIDSGSGLAGYRYSLDNSIWTNMIPEAQTYEFTGIKSATSKTIYVKAVDKLGNESKVYGPVNASTLAITDKVQINLSTDKPTQGPISADLIYSNVPSGYEVQYKLEEQTDYSSGIKITGINENTVITARIYNKTLQDEVAVNTKPVTNIDREAPTMSNVSGNPADWVNTDVTLTINGAKDNSGMLSDKPYSFDNGATWQAENTKTYAENKSDIVIKVKDYAGNIYTYPTVNITKIDKQEPTITNVSGNPTDYVNTDVTLTINGADDNASGLHKIETYSFDGGSTWQTGNTKTYTENKSNIVIKVKDAVGNIYTHTAINITYIDKTAPSKPTAIDVTPSLNKLTVKASGSSDSGSGLAGYQYKLGEDGTWSNTIAEGTEYTFEEELKSNSGVKVYAKAVDKFGYESTVYGPVDTTTSTVTNKVSIILSDDNWTKGPITADLSYDNVPLGYVIQYKIGTGAWTSGTKIPNISSNTTVYGRLYNETLDDEIATNSKDVSKIDNEPPTDPTGLEVITRNQTSIVVKASGSTDSGAGLVGYQYSINGTSWSETIASGINYTISSLTVNNKYTVYVRAVDDLGNISENNYNKEARTLSTYSVTYNSNTTETVGNMPTTQTKVEGITLTLSSNTPTRTGYTFGGWATSASGSKAYDKGGSYTANSGATLYAIWTVNKYTLTLNANGGSVSPTSISQNYGTAITLPTPTRTGYTFNGWYTAASGGSKVTYTTMPATTRTIYAQWTAITYTVKYNANGGTGTMANSSHTYNTAKNLTANTFTRDGYIFNGWSTSSTATTATYTDGQSVKNLRTTSGTINLYAVWESNPTKTLYYTYEITGGTNSSVTTKNDGTTLYINMSANSSISANLTIYDIPSGISMDVEVPVNVKGCSSEHPSGGCGAVPVPKTVTVTGYINGGCNSVTGCSSSSSVLARPTAGSDYSTTTQTISLTSSYSYITFSTSASNTQSYGVVTGDFSIKNVHDDEYTYIFKEKP